MSIPLYKIEIADGVSEKVIANASVAYASIISPTDKLIQAARQEILQSIATNFNQPDLFYLKSILATAGWNSNDDVFDPLEMWLARATSEDKPFNIGHEPREIRGHITGNYAIDQENNIIDDNIIIDDLPSTYHIVSTAVLYKFVKSPDTKLEEEMQQIIAEIGKGEWFVSMECLFTNFDYALSSANGSTNIVKRDEKSAFLTKHLRAYGGTGKYQDYKLGRVMRNIVFSGKGLVRNPANKHSIIFQNVAAFKNNNMLSMGYEKLSNEFINKESGVMATEIELLQQRIKSLEDSLVTATSQTKDYEKRLQDMNEKQVQAKVSELDQQIKIRDEKITALASQVKTEQDARTSAEAELKKSAEKASVLEVELNKTKFEQVKASRISAWSNHTGVDTAVATKSVEKLIKLDDAEFKEFLESQPAKAAVTPPTEKKDAQVASAQVLDNVQPTEKKDAPLGSAGTGDVQVAQAALSDFLSKSFLGKTGKVRTNKANKE